MSDHQISTYPSIAALPARRDATPWSLGLRLMEQRGPRVKGVLLLLFSWLAMLLLALLALNWLGMEIPVAASDERSGPLRSMAESAWPFLHRTPPVMVVVALLVVLYFTICAWMSLGIPSPASQPGTDGAAASLELQARREPRQDDVELAQARRAEAGARRHPSQDLHDAHLALQSSSQQVGAAIGEAARRTISLCGAFDSCAKHVDVAGAELDAVQDEAEHTQQVMASLRAQLLSLSSHCQAFASTAHRTGDLAVADEAAQQIEELLDALRAQIVHCHQLSERIGGAERSSQRRVDSIRRCIEAVGHQADRGLREGHQVMVLTRQIEASLAEGSQWLEELGAVSVCLDGLGEAPLPQVQASLRDTERA
jgi:hypothetical protein